MANELIEVRAVTAIQPATRPRGWLRIKAGRSTLAVLHPREAEGLGNAVRVGAPLTRDLERRLSDAAARSAARRDAERLLSRRALAAAELESRLLVRAHDAGAVRSVVQALKASGGLDDARLADAAAARALGTGRRASGQAARDLEARGVSNATARRAVAAAARDLGESDFERALGLARSRLRGELLRKDAATQRRRLAGVLARRGFEEDVVEAVLDRVVKAEAGQR